MSTCPAPMEPEMPLYEYECTACHRRTEKIQKFSDPELTECPFCGERLERTLTAPAVHFAGGGWYKDLYSSAKPAAAGGSGSGEGGAGESKTGDSKAGDSKAGGSESAGSSSGDKPAAPATPAASTPAPAPATTKSGT